MKSSESKLIENGYTKILNNYRKWVDGAIINAYLLSDNTLKITYTELVNEPRLYLLLADEIKKLEIKEENVNEENNITEEEYKEKQHASDENCERWINSLVENCREIINDKNNRNEKYTYNIDIKEKRMIIHCLKCAVKKLASLYPFLTFKATYEDILSMKCVRYTISWSIRFEED